MARVVGDFTPRREVGTAAEELAFGYFGETIRISYDFGEAAFVDWVDEYGQLGENDVKGMLATKRLMEQVVHPDDFEMFWRLARANKQTSVDLAGVFKAALEAMSERPTSRPSDSSDGPATTVPSSAGGSSQRVIDRFEAAGRPDLVAFVELAQAGATG